VNSPLEAQHVGFQTNMDFTLMGSTLANLRMVGDGVSVREVGVTLPLYGSQGFVAWKISCFQDCCQVHTAEWVEEGGIAVAVKGS
jgi:hypothetical protein